MLPLVYAEIVDACDSGKMTRRPLVKLNCAFLLDAFATQRHVSAHRFHILTRLHASERDGLRVAILRGRPTKTTLAPAALQTRAQARATGDGRGGARRSRRAAQQAAAATVRICRRAQGRARSARGNLGGSGRRSDCRVAISFWRPESCCRAEGLRALAAVAGQPSARAANPNGKRCEGRALWRMMCARNMPMPAHCTRRRREGGGIRLPKRGMGKAHGDPARDLLAWLFDICADRPPALHARPLACCPSARAPTPPCTRPLAATD